MFVALQPPSLRRWGGTFVVSFIGMFTIILLLLHATLEVVDDTDLLSRINDWRSFQLQQVDEGDQQAVPKIRTDNDNKRKKKRPFDPTPRTAFEQDHPPSDLQRIRASVEALRQPSPATHATDQSHYNVHDCPDEPVVGYPHAWSAQDVLSDWNPDDTDIPATIHRGLCIFDWQIKQDRRKAKAYRAAERPFVLRNHSDMLRVAERWNAAGYLQNLFGSAPQRTDHAASNHLMFSRTYPGLRLPAGWTPPIDTVQMSYAEWRIRADRLQTSPNQASQDHWYFRSTADCVKRGGLTALCDELPFFSPAPNDKAVFMVDPTAYRGINCRLGMKGIIAETHFDNSRNWVTVMGGQRRYVLAHPEQCPSLELFPMGHPSGRHGSQDWSHAVLTPEFQALKVNEVVLDVGDALYLPTFWFHFIVSLNISYQCNARSGQTFEFQKTIEDCGFQI